jgi:hypothetical protein
LSIKTKLIGGTSALVLAGSMMAFAGPPAGAVVTTVGTCQNLLALGTAKSSTVGLGITDQDNLDGSLSTKGVDPNTNKGLNLGSCNFVANQGVPDAAKPPSTFAGGSHSVTKWGTKLFSREFDCDTTDTTDNTEWAPSGALSITFGGPLNGSGKADALTAQVTVDGFTDGDPNTPGNQTSDVVNIHGIVTKGVALGADLTGQTEFDPTVKDKTVTTGATTGPFGNAYFGYAFDINAAVGCTTATKGDANITAFNNGSVAGKSQILGLPVSGLTLSKGTP